MRKHTHADRAFQAVTRQQWVRFALQSKPLMLIQHEKILVGGVV